MFSIRPRYVFLIALPCVVAWTAFDWFSEESRFLRFSRQAGVRVETAFTYNFVSEAKIREFISTRGYDDPFTYFEEGIGLQPWTTHISDSNSTTQRAYIEAHGGDTVTIYSITYSLGTGETRIIIHHRGDEVMEITSRAFSTSL